MEPQWLKWAKELQAIAQNGLLYASDKPFDAARYKRIREIASEMMAASGAADEEFFAELFGRETALAADNPLFDKQRHRFELLHVDQGLVSQLECRYHLQGHEAESHKGIGQY